MTTYRDLIELVLKREIGILGREKTLAVARDAGLQAGDDGSLKGFAQPGKNDLERLMKAFSEKYGVVTVIGCKVAVMRAAWESKLELPEILR